MLLTDKFVFIHLPKTGGTFVREMIGRIYGHGEVRDHKNLQSRSPDLNDPFFIMTRFSHATRRVIPEAFADLPVLGCVRNPFDRYISQYRYGSWKVASPEIYPGIRSHRNYPELRFDEYVSLANKQLWLFEKPKALLEQSIGWQTACFIRWFCRKELFDLLDSGIILTADLLRTYLEPIKFIHTDRLNENLYSALIDFGYDEREIDFIRNAPKILPEKSVETGHKPMRGDLEPAEDYFYPELRQLIRDRERLLFELFPEWDE